MGSEQLLLDMGFPKEQIDKALQACGNSTEQAMEWLLAHADDGNASSISTDTDSKPKEEPMETSISNEVITEENQENKETVEKKDEEAKSIKCDECGKLFRSPEEVEFHAAKSGHSQFSESTEEKKALTEMEKKEKLKELEEKMRLRRKEKEEEERLENIEKEKKRIQTGKNITETKQKMQEKEIKMLTEERRREKLEDKLARQKVKDQIELDRLARKEKFGGASATPAATQPKPAPIAVVAPKKNYDSARIQIRLPSGTPLVEQFKAKEPLSAVKLWITLNRKDIPDTSRPFTLSTTFPRKIFTDEDLDKPLNILGLTPSAVLVVNDSRV